MEVGRTATRDRKTTNRDAITPFFASLEVIVPLRVVEGRRGQHIDVMIGREQLGVLPGQRLGATDQTRMATRHDNRDALFQRTGSRNLMKRSRRTSTANCSR